MELVKMQQKQIAEQSNLVNSLTEQLSRQSVSNAPSSASLMEKLSHSLTEFVYLPEENVTFEAWYRRYEDIFRVDGKSLDEASLVRLLLRKLGPSEHERYCNYILPKNPRDADFTTTVETLKKIFGRRCSLFNTRYQCFQIKKRPSEDFVTYASTVNRECEQFNLKDITSDQFKCLIFVCGLSSIEDAEIRTKLLSKIEVQPDITLQALTEECQRIVNLMHDTQMLQTEVSSLPSHIHAVSRERQQPRLTGTSPRRAQQSRPPTSCWNCGGWHFARFCTFKDHVCRDCGYKGHKESYCRPKQMPPTHRPTSRLNVVLATTSCESIHSRKYLTLKINDKVTTLQIDTASDITVISLSTWISIGKPTYRPTQHVARDASGSALPILGEFSCEFKFLSTSARGICYIVKLECLNLLGLDWIEKLGLFSVPLNSICNAVCSDSVPALSSDPQASISEKQITEAVSIPCKFSTTTEAVHVSNLLQERFQSIFDEGLGKCTTTAALLYLKSDAKPVFRPKRPVPYGVTSLVETELNRLEKLGIIAPVNYSAWATPIVVVKKPNGMVRICGDFSTGLNNALETHQYPLPVPEDLFAKLNGGKFFSKIDFSDAYLQVEVHESCREFLTINTHRGLYQYNRLPFGVKCAPAIFQQIMDTMLSGLTNAMAYLDDIIVVSSSKQEHLRHLELVFERIHSFGFKLRPEKCSFMMPSVRYLGSIIDQEGRRPDPDKITAMSTMPAPTNQAQLQAFLGLVNYYNHFVPHLQTIRAPLNALLTKDKKVGVVHRL